jgi:hypothetical protein
MNSLLPTIKAARFNGIYFLLTRPAHSRTIPSRLGVKAPRRAYPDLGVGLGCALSLLDNPPPIPDPASEHIAAMEQPRSVHRCYLAVWSVARIGQYHPHHHTLGKTSVLPNDAEVLPPTRRITKQRPRISSVFSSVHRSSVLNTGARASGERDGIGPDRRLLFRQT